MSDATMLGPLPEDEATLAFLRMVLPEEGLYAVAPRRDKTWLKSIFCSTLKDLYREACYVDRQGMDAYFTVAALKSNENRKGENVRAVKALKIDIDVGKQGHAQESPYATVQDGANALARFLKATGLPTPIINETGYGLHVYWPLAEELPPWQWEEYANGLKFLCFREGLETDAGCTSDVARVLRVPGTHNRKISKSPKKVTINFLERVKPYPVDLFDKLLSIAPAPRKGSNVVPLKQPTLPSALGAMPAFLQAAPLPQIAPALSDPANYTPAYGSRVADKCAQLAVMRDTRGRMPEPEWKACIGVLAYCEDGQELAHEWSKGDERYSEQETQRKFEASKQVGGPITCAFFRGLNTKCVNCAQTCVTPKTLGESLFDPRTPPTPNAVSDSPFVNWDMTANGKKPKSLINASMSLKFLSVRCRYDVFHDRATVEHKDLERYGEKFNDSHVRALRVMMMTTHGHDPGFETCWQAIKTQCEANQYDPITEYLDSLRWDGVCRLDNWLHAYLGADDSRLNRAFARKTLLAAARRARSPGAKFDHMLVLEGVQGTGKTSAVQILAGEGNFSEQKILHLDTKAQAEQIAGKWLYEISELVGLRGRGVEDVKQFISRLSDEARPAYGREAVERPRRCVFIGTTNDTKYLVDETGNRRFWPVKTGKIDLTSLARDRDQIWAEAAHYETKGESLFLPRELWGEATEQQEKRRQEDPWEDVLRNVEGKKIDGGTDVEHRIAMNELYFAHIKASAERLTPTHGKRLTAVMHALGWEGPKILRIEGQPCKGYVKRVPKI